RNGREARTTTGEDREDEDGGGRERHPGRIGDRVSQDLAGEGGREVHRTQQHLETEEQYARAERDPHETHGGPRPCPSGPPHEPGEGDVAEAGVEDEVRRREETLTAHDDVAPDVPVESERLKQQPDQGEPEDGPSGDAGQRTKEARDIHRSALAARPPSSGRYFKLRRSRGSGLGSDSMDGHEQFGLASQPRGRIRSLEEFLSEIDGTRH